MIGRAFFHIAIAAVAAITVSGCALLQDIGGKIEAGAPQVDAVVSKVAVATRRICGFEPIAATIIGAFTAGVAAGPLEVADLICNAIKAQPLAAVPGKRGVPVTVVVRGVRIEGRLISKKGR